MVSDYTGWLGDVAKDRVSGMTGLVTLVGEHISGCDRVQLSPTDVGDTSAGSDEFFYPAQLERLEPDASTPDIEVEPTTESHVALGDVVRDKVTGFEGTAIVINYSVWNCPSVLVQDDGDADESHWVDDVRLRVVNEDVYDFDTAERDTTDTGAAEDSASPDLKAPGQ